MGARRRSFFVTRRPRLKIARLLAVLRRPLWLAQKPEARSHWPATERPKKLEARADELLRMLMAGRYFA